MPRDGTTPTCRSAFWLRRLRARQGDDALADRLYDEAMRIYPQPLAIRRRDGRSRRSPVAFGDLMRSRALLDAADESLPEGGSSRLASPWCSLAWHGGRSPPATPTMPPSSRLTPPSCLRRRGDSRSPRCPSATRRRRPGRIHRRASTRQLDLLARNTAVALAVKAITHPTSPDIDALALAQQRACGPGLPVPDRRARCRRARRWPSADRPSASPQRRLQVTAAELAIMNQRPTNAGGHHDLGPGTRPAGRGPRPCW